MTVEHDEKCEAEYIFPPGGWLPCECAGRQEQQFQLVFKGMFAAGFDAVDRMRGVKALRADDAK